MPIESDKSVRLTITVTGEDAIKHFRNAVKKLCSHMGYTRVQLEKEELEALESLDKVINPQK